MHVLSKIVFHETPKSFMAQRFRADYMNKLDATFKFYETKFHRVVWALERQTLVSLPIILPH